MLNDEEYTNTSYSLFSCTVKLLNCKRGPAHLVWNVAVKEVFMHFRIPAHRGESISKCSKRITMVQYENCLWKDIFVNRTE